MSPARKQAPRARNETRAAPAVGGGTVTSRDGTVIAYERAGTGANLVLVAGALGSKDFPFTRPFVEELSKHFTFINYDRRGRGESTDTQPFAVQREIEDLDALIKAVGPSHVFGMSSGAALVLEAAAAGVPMLSAIPFEPPYAVGEHRRPDLLAYEGNVKRLIAEGRRDAAVKLFMRIVGVPGLFLALMRIMPIWKQLRANAHTLPYDAAVMNDFQPPAKRLASIRVPTLLVYGEKSPAMLKDATRAVSKLVPGAELRSLPNQTHNLKPEAIAPVLVEFTASVAPRPTGNGASNRTIVTAPTRPRSS